MSAWGVTPRPWLTSFLHIVGHELFIFHFVKLPTLKIACANASRGAHDNPTIASVTKMRSWCLPIAFLSVLLRSGLTTSDDWPVPCALAVEIDILEPVLHGSIVGFRRRIGPRVRPTSGGCA